MESVRNSIPLEFLRFGAMDAAGLPGGVSRFLLGVDRNESYEPNHPPGEPAGFHDIMSRLCSDKRNDPPDKPAAFVKRQS
jgi:hypothetical protein